MISTSRRKFIRTASLGLAAGSSSIFCQAQVANQQLSQSAEGQGGTTIQSIRDLGVQFMDNLVNITGQDGATSIALPSGDAFWTFGDTIEGEFDSIRNHNLSNALSNTAALVPRQQVKQQLQRFKYVTQQDGKRARQIIEYLTDEDPAKHRLWAIHGVCVGEFIYVYYHKITMHTDVDVFEAFDLNGMGIARARIGEYKFGRLLAPDGTTMFWKGDIPGFGVFVESHSDGFLYLWGSFWTGMYLARARPEKIEDLSSYEYLVRLPTLARPKLAPEWSSEFSPHAVLFDSVPNEMSAAFNPYLKKYVAVHTLLRDNKLVMRTAPKLTGPWSEPELIYRPIRTSSKAIFNAGKEHPELQRQGGKVMYVTYVNSAEYAPHLIEVTLR